MRTSLNEIEQAEMYLLHQLGVEESLVFEARMLTNPVLRLNVSIQEKVYSLVRLYHKKKLKEKMEIIHQDLFNDPAKREFQHSIYNLFKS